MRFGVLAGRVVARLAAEGRIDAVEFAECEGAGAAMALLRSSGERCPATVVHMHSPTELLFALKSFKESRLTAQFATLIMAERLAILRADRVCAPSRYHADWCERAFGLGEPAAVIPLAYDAPREAPAFPASGERVVMYLGRIEPRKGVEPLVRAWSEVAPARPGWRLRLVGGDTNAGPGGASMRETLRRTTPARTLETIDFVDAVPPALLRDQFALASVCVVPSLWENFPFTCVEAMAHARPVVASDEGGMSEMFAGTEAGVAHRGGDERDLARRLLELTGEPAGRLRERGAIGRARILEMCDRGTVARRRIALYEEAVERTRRGSPWARGEAALRWWRAAARAGAGELAAVGLPRLREGVTRWLPEEVAA
jgi:glycosyltransferase involved in cell wall biosynthesis